LYFPTVQARDIDRRNICFYVVHEFFEFLLKRFRAWRLGSDIPSQVLERAQGSMRTAVPANDMANFEAIRKNYDMNTHGVSHAKNRLMGMKLDPEFVRRFTIAGPPEHCIERLLDLAHRGLDRLVCVGPSFYSESWGEERHLFVREVIPALRSEFPAPRR
jgi:hypothetical protein